MNEIIEFWCCDNLKWDLDHDGWTLKEMIEILNWIFCPYCARRLSNLS